MTPEALRSDPLAPPSVPWTPAPALHPVVIQHGRVGDTVMLTAALRTLHLRYGAPCYVVGMGPHIHDIYGGHPDVAAFWSVPRKVPFVFGRAWPAVLRAVRRTAPGPVYVFEDQRRQVPRIRRLLSLGRIDPRRCLYIDEKPGTERPWLDCMLEFAARTPPSVPAGEYPEVPVAALGRPNLQVSEPDRRAARDWLAEHAWRGEPLVLVQPGNHRTMGARRMRHWDGRDDKAWPSGHWSELLRGLRTALPEALIVLCGAAAEVSLLEHIERTAAVPRVAVAACGLRRLFALCQLAHSMISIDTGPAHAAAALCVPLVVLYGLQSPRVWLPRSGGESAVLAIKGPRVEDISPQAVLKLWRSLPGACKGEVRAGRVVSA